MNIKLNFDNRYKIIQPLGKGSFGEVYKVWDKKNEKIAALKFTKHFSETLKEEFYFLTKLTHSNLVKVYECGVWQNRFYFTMEYINGKDILTYCKNKETKEILSLVKKLLEGLDYIHSQGLVHGDIKPSNIFIGNNSPKILDFSLTSITFSNHDIKGTIGYIPPEVIKKRKFTPQSDLYSIGVLLYEILTGKLPFKANSIYELYKKQIEKNYIPIEKINPKVPKRIQNAILKLLEPFPQDRFTDAKEVINALFPGVKIEKKISLPFVGREKISKEMEDSIEKRMKKGFNAPSTILIYGGTGMGKTALLKEFAKKLSLEGIKVLRERESTTHPPLFTLIKELSMRASLNLVNRYRDELIAFYPELSNMFECRGPHKGEPPDFKKIIYFINEAISEIKDFHAILIDDLHSSLPNGINLFNFLSENLCEKAIIIATVNPDLLKKSIKIKGKKIKLPGLLPEDIKELLFINFGEMALVDELTERTYRWTSGKPLLIRKSFNIYLREGVIKEREGVYHVNIENLESDKISFSKDIDTFFKHKLEELDKDTNEFLSYFSAIGEKFPRKLISLFSKDDKGLKKAIENGILTEEKGLIQFTHPVLRNNLYQSIPLSKKRELHKEIGKVLEDSYPSRFEEILYHYLEAGDRAGVRRIIPEVLKIENLRMLKLLLRSLPCIKDKNVKKDVLEKIANLYLLLGQYSKSFKFYEKTLELEKNKRERASISYQLGLLSETMGQRMKALTFYKKGIDLLGDKKDILYVKIIGELGRVYCIMGKTKKALSYLQDALKISQLKKDIKIEALTLLKLGIVYYTQGNLKEAIKALRKVIEMDSEIKDNFMLSNAYVNLGYFYYQNREYNLAMEWYNKSLFIKKRIGDIKNIPILLINMGALLGERGEYSRALFLFKQGISLSKKNISLKTAFLANISYHFYLMGSYSETEKKLLRALKIRKKTEEKLSLPLTFKNLSLIYLDQGIYKKAIESVNEGIETTRDLENKLLEIELLSVLMNIYCSIGALKKANKIAGTLLKEEKNDIMKAYGLKIRGDEEGALSLMERVEAKDVEEKRDKALFYFCMSNDYLFLCEQEKAKRYWIQGNQIADSIGQRLPSAISLYLQGRVQYETKGLLGPEHSVHYFEEAKRHFDKMNTREYRWRTDYHLGRCKLLLGKKNEALSLFEEAIKILKELESFIEEEELKRSFRSHPERKEFLQFLANL